MSKTTRRDFLMRTGAGAFAATMASHIGWAKTPAVRLSACDWSLGAVSPEGLEVAKRIGLDGLEISAGDPADTLRIADPAYRKAYKDAMEETGLVVSSVAMGLLNRAPLATDPRGPAWLAQTIEAAHDLNAGVILMAFFGDGDLRNADGLKEDAMAVVVDRIKAAAPAAEKAGVVLGVENTLSAKQNLALLEKVGSPAVKVYYDCGNSTTYGYDVPAEIRTLGDRICQIHFKDGKNLLGQGDVDMEAAAAAIKDIDYTGWVVLETAIKDGDRDGTFRTNAAYARKLLAG